MWPDNDDKLYGNTGGAIVTNIYTNTWSTGADTESEKPSLSERLDRLEKRLSLQGVIMETQKDRLTELEKNLEKGE